MMNSLEGVVQSAYTPFHLNWNEDFTRHHITNNFEPKIQTFFDGRLQVPSHMPFPISEPTAVDGEENKDYHGIMILHNGPELMQRLYNDGMIAREIDMRENEAVIKNDEEAMKYLKTFHGDGILVYDSGSGVLHRAKNINSKRVDLEKKLPKDFIHSEAGSDYSYRDLDRALGNKTYLVLGLTEMYKGLKAVALKQSRFGRLRLGKVIEIDGDGLKNERFLTYFDRDHPEYSPKLHLERGALNGLKSGFLGIERSYHPTGKGVERDGPDRIFYRKPAEMPCESTGCEPVFGYNRARPSVLASNLKYA